MPGEAGSSSSGAQTTPCKSPPLEPLPQTPERWLHSLVLPPTPELWMAHSHSLVLAFGRWEAMAAARAGRRRRVAGVEAALGSARCVRQLAGGFRRIRRVATARTAMLGQPAVRLALASATWQLCSALYAWRDCGRWVWLASLANHQGALSRMRRGIAAWGVSCARRAAERARHAIPIARAARMMLRRRLAAWRQHARVTRWRGEADSRLLKARRRRLLGGGWRRCVREARALAALGAASEQLSARVRYQRLAAAVLAWHGFSDAAPPWRLARSGHSPARPSPETPPAHTQRYRACTHTRTFLYFPRPLCSRSRSRICRARASCRRAAALSAGTPCCPRAPRRVGPRSGSTAASGTSAMSRCCSCGLPVV